MTVKEVAPGLSLDTQYHETFNADTGIQGGINPPPLKRAGIPSGLAGAVINFRLGTGFF